MNTDTFGRYTDAGHGYSAEDAETERLLNEVTEGIEVEPMHDTDNLHGSVADIWEEGNIVEHEGRLWKIVEVETEVVSDGESFWSGDDVYAFHLVSVKGSETLTVNP